MPEWDSVASVLAGERTGQTVRLRGWVHRQRSQGKLAFVVLRDGTGAVQCTVKGGVADDPSLMQAQRAKLEAAVEELRGTVVADPRAPGGFEVKVTAFQLHEPHGPTGDFPLRGEQGTEFELDNRHLWLRSTELTAILRVKHRLYKAIRDFFDAEGFCEVDPSVITTNACEGGSTLFTFDYFGQTAYLSQSAQMYLEGCVFGIPKVYSVTPSFRAEKSRTTKHLTEFHHLEAEMAWLDAEENRVFQERLVTHLAHTVAKECEADLKRLGQDPARLLRIGTFEPGRSLADEPGKRFPRIDYAEAIAELQRQDFHVAYGEDFGVPHEKALTEGKVNPVFIIDWPANIKAFYMAQKAGTDRVLCSDLMAPDGFGEIIGGSQRSEDEESMSQRLLRQQLRDVREQVSEGTTAGIQFGKPIRNERLLVLLDELSEAVFHEKRPLQDLTADEFDSLLAALFGMIAGQHRLEAEDGANGRLVRFIGPNDVWLDKVLSSDPDYRHRLIAWLGRSMLAAYDWYFDLRRYGSVPHSGFGLGVERLLRWFTGQEHIRDMLPYPRTPARAYP